ncbi:MAG TPA: hypothetical protein VHW02_03115 [Rhizomicrobium sp.]|jgi:hypothetical protein|nr:hypothetical protein [Rhizomicrobium sp.]
MKQKSQPQKSKHKTQASLPQDFKAVACRLGADEDKARFEAKRRKLAKAAPKGK